MKIPDYIRNQINGKLGAYGLFDAKSNTQKLEIAKNVEAALKAELSSTMNVLRTSSLNHGSKNQRIEAEELGAKLQVVREKIIEVESDIAAAKTKETMIKKASLVMEKARAEIAEIAKLAGVPMSAVSIRASVFNEEILNLRTISEKSDKT